jgi:chromosome segregation ATPase
MSDTKNKTPPEGPYHKRPYADERPDMQVSLSEIQRLHEIIKQDAQHHSEMLKLKDYGIDSLKAAMKAMEAAMKTKDTAMQDIKEANKKAEAAQKDLKEAKEYLKYTEALLNAELERSKGLALPQ